MIMLRLAKLVSNISVTKFVAKWSVRKVPIFGWGMECLDCAFVKRNWTRDEAQLSTSFQVLRDYPVPVWLHIFPEGGRFSDERQRAAASFAEANGLPVFKHVLYPRARGFNLCADTLREKFDAVYDVTLAWETPAGIWQAIASKVPYGKRKIHVHVRRFDMEDIPTDEMGVRAWLYERFYYKDRLLQTFHKTGAFQPVDDVPITLKRTAEQAVDKIDVAAAKGKTGEVAPLKSPRDGARRRRARKA